MKATGARIFLLLMLQMLTSGISHAAVTDGSKIADELSKQQQIYETKEALRDDGYVVDRTLVG